MLGRDQILRLWRHESTPRHSWNFTCDECVNWVNRAIQWLGQILIGRWREPDSRYLVHTVTENPLSVDVGEIYLVGERDHLWHAVMACPCGCGASLYLSLLADDRPRWAVVRNNDGTISLSPSVWRQVGCRSHFFLRHGRIVWCED